MVESGWVVLGKNVYKNWKTNAADNDNLNDAGDSFKNQNADKTLINKMLTFKCNDTYVGNNFCNLSSGD